MLCGREGIKALNRGLKLICRVVDLGKISVNGRNMVLFERGSTALLIRIVR